MAFPLTIQGQILCKIEPTPFLSCETLLVQLATGFLELRPRRLRSTKTAICFVGNVYRLWPRWNVLYFVDRGTVAVDLRKDCMVITYRLSLVVWVVSMSIVPLLLFVAYISGGSSAIRVVSLGGLVSFCLIVSWNIVFIGSTFRGFLLELVGRQPWIKHAA